MNYFIVLHDRLLGVGRIHNLFKDGVHYAPFHAAFCCPACGEVWARCAVECAESKWTFTPWLCDKCGIGTLWLPHEEHNRALPVEALEREFLIAYEYPTAWYFGGWARKDGEMKRPRDSDTESLSSEEELLAATVLDLL